MSEESEALQYKMAYFVSRFSQNDYLISAPNSGVRLKKEPTNKFLVFHPHSAQGNPRRLLRQIWSGNNAVTKLFFCCVTSLERTYLLSHLFEHCRVFSTSYFFCLPLFVFFFNNLLLQLQNKKKENVNF